MNIFLKMDGVFMDEHLLLSLNLYLYNELL